MECSNYRTIALTSHLGKVLMMILTERLRSQIEEHTADEQAGFRKDRSTVQYSTGCARVIWSGPPVSPVAKRHQ